VRTARQDFIQEHGRPPTVPEISELLGITEEETIETLGATDAYQPISLDVPVTDDQDTLPLADLLGISQMHVSRLITRTLTQLRTKLLQDA
jgi:RNA polymerase sigma-B factor